MLGPDNPRASGRPQASRIFAVRGNPEPPRLADMLDVTQRCGRCGRDRFHRIHFLALQDGHTYVEEPFTATPLRRSSSKVVLLALGVGAALGFVAGWVAR